MAWEKAKQITNLYLYGTSSTPSNLVSDSIIRPDTGTASLSVPLSTFMSPTGAGRFAVGRQFDLINDFFAASISQLPANTAAKPYYTKQEVASKLGYGPSDFYGWNMQQYNYRDSFDDYAERTYIYNSMSFKIVDDARFYVSSTGTKKIENFGIVPNIDAASPENFDFVSSNWVAGITNPYLESRIDPSHIGRKVVINFTGDVARTTYDRTSYNADQSKILSWSGVSPTKLKTDIDKMLNDFWASGTDKFLDVNKPILYGSDKADNIIASQINSTDYPTLDSYKNNGVTIFGGKGNDILTGAQYNDKLYGGENDDLLVGLGGNDTLNGGAGKDILSSGGGSDILEGGANSDIYNVTGSGTAAITINDTGKDDWLFINGHLVAGEVRAPTTGAGEPNEGYIGKYFVKYDGNSTLKVTDGSTSITLSNWQPNDYGIRFDFVSPLVVDLEKNGLSINNLTSKGHFDIDADGFGELIDWVYSSYQYEGSTRKLVGDGFIVVDSNKNGFIDNVSEMFGDNGGTSAWAKLAAFDSNRDNIVNNKDANWSSIKIWCDTNQDQWTQAGELYTPTSLKIAGFNYANDGYRTTDYNITKGNLFDGRSTWIDSSGVKGYIYDVFFRIYPEYSVYLGDNLPELPSVSLSTFRNYPVVREIGNVLPSYIAIAKDPTLKTLFDNFKKLQLTAPVDQVNDQLSELLIRWAGKHTVSPTSRGADVDGREVATLEAFKGVDTIPVDTISAQYFPWKPGQLLGAYADDFRQYWQDLLADMKSAILIKSAPNIFPNAFYSYNQFHTRFDDSVEAIASRSKTAAPTTSDTMTHNYYWSNLYTILKDNGGYGLTVAGKTYFSSVELQAALLPYAQKGTIIADGFYFGTDAGEELQGLHDEDYFSAKSGDDDVYGWYGNDTIYGDSGNDHLNGGHGDDLLVGGAGDDWLEGIWGNDLFVINQNEGFDTVWGSADQDTLSFGNGIAWNSIQFSHPNYNDILIKTAGTSTILLKDGARENDGVELFRFSDGTSKTLDDVKTKIVLFNTVGNDTLYGFDGRNDLISGAEGNDSIWGLSGDDTLSGNSGDDTIFGFSGNDVITGGTGKDSLGGGLGDNVFRYNNISESSKIAPDVIDNFGAAEGDLIDLRGLGFTGLVSGAPIGTKLGFVYDSVTDDVTITANTDFKIILIGNQAYDASELSASDFIFV